MRALHVQGSHTFFQGQQTLVDFCSFDSSLSIVALGILSSLRPCQIDKEQFSKSLTVTIFHIYLTNGMGSRRTIIGCCLMCSPDTMTVVYDFRHFGLRFCRFLLQPLYLDSLVFIFKDLQLLFPIEQIHDLSTVYFKETEVKLDSLGSILICNCEQILDRRFCSCIHGKCLSRSGLSISETRHYSIFKDTWK